MLKFIKKIFFILLATAGIRIDQINKSRIIAIGCICIGYLFHLVIADRVSLKAALLYFALLFITRYVFLFWGFAKNGFSGWLIKKYGESKAWNIYEVLTSVMFFQRGLSFGLLIEATQWSILNITQWIPMSATEFTIFRYSCIGFGICLALFGMWINLSSAMVIGIDTYYYKDLFLKKALGEFKVAGSYKYFSNPMYGVGQLSGYGAALMAGSILGILATFLNQMLMYLFYFLIEKPHIKSVFSLSQRNS